MCNTVFCVAFWNRTDDLAALDDHWHSPTAEFLVLWGRRRVGKTELLTHFAESRRSFYFEATDVAQVEQLADLSKELARISGNPLLVQQPLTSWTAALTAITQFVSDQPTVIVFDEYQYLARRESGLGSLINHWWRTVARDLPIVFVIAGSEVSFFEREVLAGETYGRRTGQMHVLPFGYRDAALFHPGYSPEDRIRTYAVCGGMPYYLERFTDDVPLREHLLRHTLYRDGFLYEEADLLLRQELPEPRNYMSVLRAIAQGHTKNSEVAHHTQLDSSQIGQIVATLERLQLVRTIRPVTATDRSNKTSYEILNGFLSYYFRFVDPAKSRLRTRHDAEQYLDEVVWPGIDAFVSKPAWELLCQEHVRDAESAAAVGVWWGMVPTGEGRRTKQQEIDIVALRHDRSVVATGSCKWTNSPLDRGEEDLLIRTEPFIPSAKSVTRHYFCSRESFTDGVHRLAENEPDRIRLVTPVDLYR